MLARGTAVLIIRAVARRIHVSSVKPGETLLDASQAHHVRDVLRLKVGANLELFDDAGMVGDGTIAEVDPARVVVRVTSVQPSNSATALIVASAVPKSDRADWMIEKLSELGVSRFVPLQTARSVVHPTGAGKRDRWIRIATESAKQSRRAGVMQIDELTRVESLLAQLKAAVFCTTANDAISIREIALAPFDSLTILIGPEGGWTQEEIAMFRSHNLTGVKLTATILRVETAAVAAAAIAANLLVAAPR
jgi:16S rRNA (uracil1498-N3)-methyltransferase